MDVSRSIVVAEVGQAHDGSLGLAHAFIDAAAAAGADAIKFQTHIAAAESTPDEPWRVKFSRQDASRYEYWRRMEFTEDHWRGLRQHADERGLQFVSSPFSLDAVDLLRRIGVAAWKIASGEITNRLLIDRVVEAGGPVWLSTGLSTLEEVDDAVAAVRGRGVPLVVFQCTSEYPCPPERVGLNVLELYRQRYDCPVGLSDHSGTIYAGLAAVTLGAKVIEVHLTLSREMFGPDVPASVTPAELKQLVDGVHFIERANASPVDKTEIQPALQALRHTFMKSIVASRDLPAGALLQAGDLLLKKPGTGIPPSRLAEVLGRRLGRAVVADQLLRPEDLV